MHVACRCHDAWAGAQCRTCARQLRVTSITSRAAVRRVGLETPSVEIRFDSLRIEAEIQIGDRGRPTILNSYRKRAPAGSWPAHCVPCSVMLLCHAALPWPRRMAQQPRHNAALVGASGRG